MTAAMSQFDPVQHPLIIDQLPSGLDRAHVDELTESLLSLAITAGEKAADHILNERPDDLSVATKSSATDMVTEMDQASERILVETILGVRPGDQIVGEEGTADDVLRTFEEQNTTNSFETGGVTWWIDPIDGTTNYVYNHPGFNISIAAGIDDRVLVGVVIDPYNNVVYSARFGHGAYVNDRKLAPTPPPTIDKVLLATGFSYSGPRRRAQMLAMAEVVSEVRDIRRMGAAAMDLCGVAAGRVDAYYELGLSVWDFAAGALIAHEAGYTVRSLNSDELRGASILVSHPQNFEALQTLIVNAGALDIE